MTPKLAVVQDLEARPKTRGDCVGGIRPCPWVACRHHLYLEVHNGRVHLNHPDKEPWDLAETCSLDVADRCGSDLTQRDLTASSEEVGQLLGVGRQRADQIEHAAKQRLKQRLTEEISDDAGYES